MGDEQSKLRALLLDDLMPLEAARKKTFRSLLLTLSVSAPVTVGAIIVMAEYFFSWFWALVIVCFDFFAFQGWYVRHYSPYRKEFKSRIIPRILDRIAPGLTYDPSGSVSEEEIEESDLFAGKRSHWRGEDLVSGKIGQTNIRCCELRVYHDRKHVPAKAKAGRYRESSAVFSGLFLVADFPKSFKTTILVLPDKAEKLLGDLGQGIQELVSGQSQLVKLEHPEFEKLFAVYGEDQIESRYVLSTSLVQRLLEFRNKVGKPIRLCFARSRLYMAIPFNRDLLEPPLVRSLLRDETISGYYQTLRLMIDVVEDLNLNTRIWSLSA